MSDSLNLVYKTIDEQHAGESAATRRQIVAGAAATIGSLGLLGLPAMSEARSRHHSNNTPKNILNAAATVEVLATIVNTVGSVGGQGGQRFQQPVDLTDPSGPQVTKRNVMSAAREELVHYNVLVSHGFGGRAATGKIWVPDAVFSSRKKLLETLEVGDQIFMNAYLIGTTTFGNAGKGTLARVTAEFMGVESVHRALARQSLGKLGNDRIFVKYNQRETADSPNRREPGFTDISGAVSELKNAGFGFGERGQTPGQFYEFDKIRRRTPNDSSLNTSKPH